MYIEIFLYFLKLGCVGFGGPLAIIAQMQKDLISTNESSKKWISEEEFNQAFALVKAMPGAIAYQMSVFLGQHRGRTIGGILAGLAMVLPSFFLMILLALSEQLPQFHKLDPFFKGMQISALGAIAGSLLPLIKDYVRSNQFILLCVLGMVITYMLPSYEPLIIVLFGIGIVLFKRNKFFSMAPFMVFFLIPDTSILGQLFWYCFKAGAFVFGTGLAVIPMLEHDFVTKTHWFTHAEFMNALALGQITPGPVTITVTYLGFKTAGLWGAITTTLGVYAASTVNMLTWFPRALKKLSRLDWMPQFMFGALAAVAGSIISTLIRLSLNLNLNTFDYIVIAVAFVLVLKNYLPTWLTIILFGSVYMLVNIL